MNQGLFITGTDTEVGKTEVTGALAAVIQEQLARSCKTGRLNKVNVWKPVQSGAPLGDTKADSFRLRTLSGLNQAERDIATMTFSEPYAPWIAARRAGREIDFDRLVEEGLSRLRQRDFLIAEGAGGLLVPLTESKTMADLMSALNLPAVIVARPELGTVNHTLLTAAHLRQRDVAVKGVILNGCKHPNSRHVLENAMMIEKFGEVPVLARLPWMPVEVGVSLAERRRRWIDTVKKHIDTAYLIEQ